MDRKFSRCVDILLESLWLSKEHKKFSESGKEYALHVASKLVPAGQEDNVDLEELAKLVGLLPTRKAIWIKKKNPKTGKEQLMPMQMDMFPSEYYEHDGTEIPAKVSPKHNQLLLSIKTTAYQQHMRPEKQEVVYMFIPDKKISDPIGPKISDLDQKLNEAILSEEYEDGDDEEIMKLPSPSSKEMLKRKEEFLKRRRAQEKLSNNLDTTLDPEPESEVEIEDPEQEIIRNTNTLWPRGDDYIIMGVHAGSSPKYAKTYDSITIEPGTYMDIDHKLLGKSGELQDHKNNGRITIDAMKKYGVLDIWRIRNKSNSNIQLPTEPVVMITKDKIAVELDRITDYDLIKKLKSNGIVEFAIKTEEKGHVNREKAVEKSLNKFPVKFTKKPGSRRDIGAIGKDKMLTLTHFILDFQQPLDEFEASSEAYAKDQAKEAKRTPKETQPSRSEAYKMLRDKKKGKKKEGPSIDDIL